MSITNYGELKTAVANWLNRSDLEQRIPEFIALATATLNKVLRDSRMVAHDSVSVSAGGRYGALPSGLLEPIFVTSAGDEDVTLEQVSVQQLNWLRKRITGRANYRRLGERLGLPLEADPDLALKPALAARILARGMAEGLFTGKRLSDYFGEGRCEPAAARRIVNGTDRAEEIAGYFHRFRAAL